MVPLALVAHQTRLWGLLRCAVKTDPCRAPLPRHRRCSVAGGMSCADRAGAIVSRQRTIVRRALMEHHVLSRDASSGCS